MRVIWVITNVVVWTIVLATTGILLSLFEWRGRVMAHIGRIWSKIILFTSGISYSVQGLENLDPKRHYVFTSNHESAYDIPLAFAGLPFQMVPIAKKELRKIPLFGWAMRMGKHIFVDRGNREKALISLKEARNSLVKNPRSVLLFPEGTRSLDGKVHQFKKGGLVLALETNMPVVPIAMCGTSGVITKGSWKFSSVPIELRVGIPIETENLSYGDRSSLAQAVRKAIIDLKSGWEAENT